MFGVYEPGQRDPRAVVDNLIRARDLLAGHLTRSPFERGEPSYQPPTPEEVTAALALATIAHAQTLALVAIGGQADPEEADALTKIVDIAMQPAPTASLRWP